ncbi:MAG: hypothetical protein KY468_00670 [Armatimonadetes bacterium]|nr:hypothetical protein [Armatimonadota bacterium]
MRSPLLKRHHPILLAALAGSGLALTMIGGADSSAAQSKATARARQGGAAPQGQVGAFRFGANEFAGETLKTGGVRFILNGNAQLIGQGRTIAAGQMSIDVPKGASDISVGRATGNVRMTMALEEGRRLTTRGNSLIYRRQENTIDLGGGVTVQTQLEGGGSLTATGNTAQVLAGARPRTATLSGNVRLTLVKPDTLEGPAVFTGPSMVVDLESGNWKMTGGRTQGNFNLKPRPGGQ